MKEYKNSKYPSRLVVTDFCEVPADCKEADKLLFLQFANKYLAKYKVGWFHAVVLKSVMDTDGYRFYIGSFELKKGDRRWEQPIMAVLNKATRMFRPWLPVYVDLPVYTDWMTEIVDLPGEYPGADGKVREAPKKEEIPTTKKKKA